MSRKPLCGMVPVLSVSVLVSVLGGCSKTKTAAPVSVPTTPLPKVLAGAMVSPRFGEIVEGQKFTISISVQNQGLDSDSGMICVSFPNLTDPADAARIQSTSAGTEPGHEITVRGEPIVTQSCQTDTARYVMAQLVDASWRSGKVDTYTLQVQPPSAGIFTVLVRSALRVPSQAGSTCQYITDLPANGIGQQTDQQGWPAEEFQIQVVSEAEDSSRVLQQVLIQSGSFSMGSPIEEEGRSTDEGNQGTHTVQLTQPFFLLAHEVSQTEWETVMGWDPSVQTGSWRPAENLSFYDALNYCNKRSDLEGLTRAYRFNPTIFDSVRIDSSFVRIDTTDVAHPDTATIDTTFFRHTLQILAVDSLSWDPAANGYRLPTEAEWEYACRAGTSTAFYTGGISTVLCQPRDPALDDAGWYCGNSGSQAFQSTHDVAQKRANAWKLYDMSGNVWEWCWDIYGPYPTAEVIDPTGAAPPADSTVTEYRVLRGGGWDSAPNLCRSASRRRAIPGGRADNVGFRIARNAF